MKITLLFTLLYFVACGNSSEKRNTVVIGNPTSQPEPVSEVSDTKPDVIKPIVPANAVTANFKTDQIPFYAFVKSVDRNKGITTINFENNKAPALAIPETFGAKITILRFDEFDRDLLLVNTKIKDPEFNKYHLYILKNSQWLPIVKPFAIHESHVTPDLKPIIVDPENPNKMFRYYSVFDLDETSELGYTWRLFNESVAILNK